MAELDSDDLAGTVAKHIASAMLEAKKSEAAVVVAELKKDVEQLQKSIASLEEVVYRQHEPVILWSRNFMDSYRKIVTAVIVSGLITFIGFVIQGYYLIQKSK